MSELSTVAIKDGHRGHNPHHHNNPSSHSDAERADRISRLAGLERVTTARNNPPQPAFHPNQYSSAPQQQQQQGPQSQGQPQFLGGQQQQTTPVQSYFDASGNPAIHRERSTVGSASATGSVGARTTWAGSDTASNMDSNLDSTADFADDASMGGMSEEGTPSLVAFGEGARTPARMSVYGGTPVRTTPRAEGGAGMLGQREREVGMEITSQDRMTSHIEEEKGERRNGE